MFNMSENHRSLALTSFVVFVLLSTIIAIVPAVQMQQSVQPLSKAKDLTTQERDGLHTYIAEGCVSCHSQQVRNIEMDKIWGDRPSLPSDYYYSKQRMGIWRQSPSLLGSERTGPDLTNVGKGNQARIGTLFIFTTHALWLKNLLCHPIPGYLKKFGRQTQPT